MIIETEINTIYYVIMSVAVPGFELRGGGGVATCFNALSLKTNVVVFYLDNGYGVLPRRNCNIKKLF